MIDHQQTLIKQLTFLMAQPSSPPSLFFFICKPDSVPPLPAWLYKLAANMLTAALLDTDKKELPSPGWPPTPAEFIAAIRLRRASEAVAELLEATTAAAAAAIAAFIGRRSAWTAEFVM